MPATYRRALWLLTVGWTVAALFALRTLSPVGILVGLCFGSLTVAAFRFGTWDKDRRGRPREARSDFWLAVWFPALFVFGSMMPIREQQGPGIPWGVAAAAGVSVALAAWFSWKWRGNNANG